MYRQIEGNSVRTFFIYVRNKCTYFESTPPDIVTVIKCSKMSYDLCRTYGLNDWLGSVGCMGCLRWCMYVALDA